MSVHHDGRSTGYAIDLTPLTEPGGTYYAALNWDGGYAGLQRTGSRYDRQLQFSVWDGPDGGDAQVVEHGRDVICTPFGGEGTGQKCELEYPWRVGATYRFAVTEENLNGGSAMTLHVTDMETGRRKFVGTLRYAARANLSWINWFVEDFERNAPTCLEQDVRSAAFGRLMTRMDGRWVPMEAWFADFAPNPTDANNPGTPGCANVAGRPWSDRQGRRGVEVVMGGRMASNPADWGKRIAALTKAGMR